jgi:hypothetical protein
MHLEIIPRQTGDLAGSGQGRDRTLVHGDRLRFGIAFAAGFVIVIELRAGVKVLMSVMYSNEHYTSENF